MLYFYQSQPNVKLQFHLFKDLYVKIYAIGYYSGFYSPLKDKNWRNGDHFEFLSKDEEKGHYSSFMVSHLSSNHDKQMMDAFHTSKKVWYYGLFKTK